MRYLGSKKKFARRIAEEIDVRREPGQTFWEPFVGSCSVMPLLTGPRIASDLHPGLIKMYKALQEGWVPEDIDERTWLELKSKQDMSDPRTALAGFGYSFYGGWFSRHQPSTEKCGAGLSGPVIQPLRARMEKCLEVEFRCCDYHDIDPEGWIIWADPPYDDTRKYDAIGKFDSHSFWDWARKVGRRNTLLISGYQCPEDFESVWSYDRTSSTTTRKTKRPTEHLFMLRGTDPVWKRFAAGGAESTSG